MYDIDMELLSLPVHHMHILSRMRQLAVLLLYVQPINSYHIYIKYQGVRYIAWVFSGRKTTVIIR